MLQSRHDLFITIVAATLCRPVMWACVRVEESPDAACVGVVADTGAAVAVCGTCGGGPHQCEAGVPCGAGP